MNYDNTTVLNEVMAIISRRISKSQASSFHKVPYMNILNVITALESIQEQRVTPLVENDNKKQIYRWVRNYVLLPFCKRDYTYWDICQSVEVIILLKLICTAIHDDFVAPNNSLQRYTNVILPSQECSSLKHLWYIMSLGEISKKL